MEATLKKRPLQSCLILFCICGAARTLEYFAVRTDETVLSENFLHKVFGIILLAVLLRLLRWGWQDIGFTKRGSLSGIAKGFLLGGCCFAAAYSAECLILYHLHRHVSLAFYASGFSLSGEAEMRTGPLFLLLCVAFNIINVWMEEGMFRGLFAALPAKKLPFSQTALVTAFLFGIWHWTMPFRDHMDGDLSLPGLLVMGAGYILLAGMMSIKWSLLYRATGSLWMGLGDHLFNNVIATNLLHVVSNHQTDSLQLVRVLTGQLLSFALVVLYIRKTAKAPR